MTSDKKKGKGDKKGSKAKTRIDDLEPHRDDDDVKGGATLSLASTDTRVTADLSEVAKKIKTADLNFRITTETKPTSR